MHRYIAEFARRSVPRYTSYPTAAEFDDRVGVADQAAALAAVAPGTPVSLYVHIPYCHAICWYCGCNTGAIGRPVRIGMYLAALAQEIDTVAARLRGRIVSVHFGGGSPNTVPADALIGLVDRLRERFACDDRLEIAVELDPRALDRGYCDALAAAGVTRVSLGVQSFAQPVQQHINRIQPYAMVARAVADLRAAGVAAVNLDLMYGLPAQSADDLEDTLARARSLAPDRIAMFGYAHMPRLLPRQRMIDDALLPDAAARFAQSALTHDVLTAAGYVAIGFDHFATPGDSLTRAAAEGRLRRNFQGFTDDPAEAIVGLGASSISQYPGLLVQNEKHVGRYRLRVTNGGLAGTRGVVRSVDDRLRGAIIERLLCDGSVDLAALARTHHAGLGAFRGALSALGELAAHDLVWVEGWRVTIPPAGRAYARLVAAAFDRYRAPQADRFSRAV